MMPIGMEEYAWVLDYLPTGKVTDRYKQPIAQVVGESYFTLLEVVVRPNVSLTLEQRIYVGKGERPEITKIRGRISYQDLTSTAKSQLHPVLIKIVEKREQDFVRFFNECGPVNIRLHQLELLPGIGKRHMEDILEERKKSPFKSFADIRERIPLLPNPVLIIANRVEEEIKGETKYYLFVKPPYVPDVHGAHRFKEKR